MGKAQSSLEYLIILASFFCVLGIILPIIFQTTNGFLLAGDDFLAKRIASNLSEEINLITFLGNGSMRTFEYVPINGITLYSSGNFIIIETKNRQHKINVFSAQVLLKQEYTSKFWVDVSKIEGKIRIGVRQS